MDILSEQDTFFGKVAYRNKLITAEQLQEAVERLHSRPGMRLGDALLELGYLTRAQVDKILDMQQETRQKFEDQTPSYQHTPEPAPAPSPPEAGGEDDLSRAIAELEAVEEAPAATEATPAAPPPPPPAASVLKVEGQADLADYLLGARESGASDLHISAGSPPFLRLHGTLRPADQPPMPAHETERLLFQALSTEQKSLLIERHSLEFCLDLPGAGRFRSLIFKQRLGYDAVFRVIGERVPRFKALGLPEPLMRLTEYQQGLALVTGPANSGKTTTLAALIDAINHGRDDHIITVEAPVEYRHTPRRCQVSQREVGLHTRSYAAALNAALREDPDIIMVGELRDLETLSMAITASETGHLVFGTLHTSSAARTVSRVLDGFPVGQQAQVRMMISESLRGVVSQQLLPRKDGSGRALALEILFVTPAVGALIRDNNPAQIPSVMQTSRKLGMRLMDDSLLELAEQGIVSGEVAWRRAEKKAAFERLREQG